MPMKRLFGSYTWKDIITDLVYCGVGSALVGLSLSMFTIPNDIAPGGVSGLSTALAYITPIRVSICSAHGSCSARAPSQ